MNSDERLSTWLRKLILVSFKNAVDHKNRARYYHGAGGGFTGGATMVHGELHCIGGGGGSYSDDPNATFDHHYVKFGECKIKKVWICIVFLIYFDRIYFQSLIFWFESLNIIRFTQFLSLFLIEKTTGKIEKLQLFFLLTLTLNHTWTSFLTLRYYLKTKPWLSLYHRFLVFKRLKIFLLKNFGKNSWSL